jgi:YHS domain-containing protein
MSALLWFAIWAALIFLMMRVGCGAHVMGPGHDGKSANGDPVDSDQFRWIPPAKDVDPVCGKTVKTGDAKSSVFDGRVYYFCSRDCREVFETAPDTYVAVERPNSIHQLEHGHG